MTVKKEIQKILHPEKSETLHPPKAPEIVKVTWDNYQPSASGEITIGDNIFEKIAHNTDFQRLVTWIIKQVDPMFKGVTTRNNSEMLNQIRERSQIATDFYNTVRGSKLDYKECMNELKEVLEKRKHLNV